MKAFPYMMAGSVLVLSACSGEPSERDIRKAFDYTISQAMESASSFGVSAEEMKELMPELHGLRKIGCSEVEGAGGYSCNVEIDMTMPMLGRQKDVSTVHLVKGSDGWRVLE